MRKTINNLFYLLLITIFTASASNLQAQTRPYRVTDSQVQYLLNRIEQRTDTYKRTMNTALDRSVLQNSDTEDMVMNYITEFENATDALKQKFDVRESVSNDVEDVLNRATFINAFMQRNRLTPAAQSQWTAVRTDLNTLATYYSMRWAWTNPTTTTVMTKAPYRVADRNVQVLLTRIETRTDNFKRVINNSLDRSRMNNTNSEDAINNYIADFENATDSLKQRFDARRSVAADVENVLSRAGVIEGFLRDMRTTPNAQRQWNLLKTDLDTLANYYSVSWNWNNATMPSNNTVVAVPYRVSDTNVNSILARLEQRTDAYKREMNLALDRSVLNNTRSEDSINQYITQFEAATDSLRRNFDARRSTAADVENVLSRAYYIDSFMRDYRFANNAEREWAAIRTDLNTLTGYYNVSWNWDRQYVPASKFDSMISGTYRLNLNQSDNVSEVVDRALANFYNANQRERVRTNLEKRLQSPEMLAIEKRNNQVVVASSISPQITFDADGVARSERTANGRNINVTAKTYYDGVAVSYEGDRVNDFYVNFVPLENGQLRVIRRVYLENRNETVTVASVYDKINNSAQWAMVTNNNNNPTYAGGNANTNFVIPNGTQLVAVLNTPVSTQASQAGDRFTMQVRSPSQFDGAIIEGRVATADKSGRVSGRANVSLEFDTIRLRNGQTYRFAGIIDSVKAANGDDVGINNEGTIRDSNQTTKTVTRAGIGAGIGALIGAIVGGGQGAAIGAAIGAGAGGGSVLLGGRDNIELGQGSEFMITASAPNNIR